jgi:hypothetical protein
MLRKQSFFCIVDVAHQDLLRGMDEGKIDFEPLQSVFEMVICYHIRILGQPSLSRAFQISTCMIETCVQVSFT